MASNTVEQPSFSTRRRWSTGAHVVFLLLVTFSVVVMVNYLSQGRFARLHWSARTRLTLAPRTVHILHSITNEVHVIVYYDKQDPLYSTVTDLLKEYQAVNPLLHVQTVDYLLDGPQADKIKAEYKDKFATPSDKNLVIFDYAGRVKVVSGEALADYTIEQLPGDKDGEFRRKPVAFNGEMAFSAALLAVSNPKPLKAYFLTGHGEGRIDGAEDANSYHKLASVLRQNYIQVESLSLFGSNAVPADCHLLVIAGPKDPLLSFELDKVEQYLNQGGRLFILFSFESAQPGMETRLEKLLAKWGVEVTSTIIHDPQMTSDTSRQDDVLVGNFGKQPHPIVNSLQLSYLRLLLPRAVGKLKSGRAAAPDAPKVEEIAFTGPNAYIDGVRLSRQSYPLMVAVEKGAVNGVITERGTTRIVVVGDSLFLNNRYIDSGRNRDFAGYAANWLLDRPQLLEGVGPKPVGQYRLMMPRTQLEKVEWLLLAVVPGAVLLLGGVVWLRRRG